VLQCASQATPTGNVDGRDQARRGEGLRLLPRGLWRQVRQCGGLVANDRNVLHAFYDFPAEHRRHIRTTNPIESTFATVRLGTTKTKSTPDPALAHADGLRPTQQIENNGMTRPPPRVTHCIPSPRFKRPLNLLIFLVCSSRQCHNLWYVSEEMCAISCGFPPIVRFASVDKLGGIWQLWEVFGISIGLRRMSVL